MKNNAIDQWLLSLDNDTEDAKRKSIDWFKTYPEKMQQLQDTGDAASQCFLFIPPPAIIKETDLGLTSITTEAFTSMNTSYLLAIMGFYSSAFHALRQTLEMSMLCAHFSVNELGTGNIRRWREGKFRAPMFSKMLKLIEPKYSTEFGTKHRSIIEYSTLYSKLSSWTHLNAAKGKYFYSNIGDGHTSFDVDAFEDWIQTFFDTLRQSIIILLISFPSYTLELPEKEIPDAYVGPWNFTFPDPEITRQIASFIGPVEWKTLRALADKDIIGKKIQDTWQKNNS